MPPEFEGRHELDGVMQVDELPAALRENLLAREEAAARSAAALLRAEQWPCEPSEDFVSKFIEQ